MLKLYSFIYTNIISFIVYIFLNEIIKKEDFYINIKKISSIKVRKLENKKYKIYEYIIIFIYLFSENDKVILIRYKTYIVNDLLAKIFIDINIIKSEVIV